MLTRDVRLSERELYHGREAIQRRMRELRKRLERTSYAGKPGMEQAVRDELAALTSLAYTLDIAHRAIGRSFAEKFALKREAS